MSTMTRPLTIAVDVDGVLYELVPVLRDWFHHRHGFPLSRLADPVTYSIQQAWGITNEELLTALCEGVVAGETFWKGAAYQPGLDGLAAMKATGHRIILVTARDLPGHEDLCREATQSWLADVGAVYDDLILASDKTTVAFDVLIDDYEKNVRAAHAAGRDAILLNRDWNQSVALPQLPWTGIPDWVEEIAARTVEAA